MGNDFDRLKAELETAEATIAMLREALQYIVDNVQSLKAWERAQAALAASSDEWLERHDAKKDAEVTRLRNVVTAAANEAERLYWLIRGRLDEIPGWVHGDDGPCHPILNLSQLMRKSLNKP